MRAIVTLCAVLACVFALTQARSASAKGNDVWVLTGGQLGDYAAVVTIELVEGTPGPRVPTPERVPVEHYDFLNSSGNFAIPDQLARGASVRYYPEIGLLRYQSGGTAPDSWYSPNPWTAASVRNIIADALAAKDAGRLERNPIVVDWRYRSLEKVGYLVQPWGAAARDLPGVVSGAPITTGIGYPPGAQITGARSERFVLQALAETVSSPPAGMTIEPAEYEISYSGEIRPASGIGGVLGYYSPPTTEHGGRFWPEQYSGRTEYYETTPDFDAILSAAIGGGEHPADSSPRTPAAGSGRASSLWTTIALVAGGIVTLVGGRLVFMRRASTA